MEDLYCSQELDKRVSEMPFGSLITDRLFRDPRRHPDGFDHFDGVTSRQDYWPETTGKPGKDWASYEPEESPDKLATEMYVSKRSTQSFRTIRIGSYDYAVVNSGTDDDYEAALTLHDLNMFALSVIDFIGERVMRGQSTWDLSVDYNQVVIMYGRMRRRYSANSVYEATDDEEGSSSYVINLGEEVHMCIRGNGRYDKQAVLYTVMTHELAHVASSTPDHDDEFWDNYAILRKIVAKMGIIEEDDIPSDSGTHCQKIKITRSEMLGIAKSDFIPTSLPLRMQRPTDIMSERTHPREISTIRDPFFTQNRSPFSPSAEGSEGAKDVLGSFDWRYGTMTKESPIPRMEEPKHMTLGHSGQYTRMPYAMGRFNIHRGESLHASVEQGDTYSKWHM